MTEYYMLITKAMLESHPDLAKDIFRKNLSRRGIVGDISFREETNWLTGDKTGVVALIAEVNE